MTERVDWTLDEPLDIPDNEDATSPAANPWAPESGPTGPASADEAPGFWLGDAPLEATIRLLLRVQSGPASGVEHRVGESGASIGRETGNDLQLLDGKVSREHLRIDYCSGAWRLVDLDSRNGTRVNGVPVTRAGLSPGDFIYLGDSVIRVERAD